MEQNKNKLCFRTDFADEVIIEKKKNEDYSLRQSRSGAVRIVDIEIFEGRTYMNKREGSYVSIEFPSIYDKSEREEIENVLINRINKILKRHSIKKKDKILVVGLGNRQVTADALGPMVVADVAVTSHLSYFLGKSLKNSRPVAALSPGVMGQTGLESSDIIASIVKMFNPQAVICIDALASRSITRINRVIQITDTGISPGSGLGSPRKNLSKEILGVPVIAIGVATVVEAASIVDETIDLLVNKVELKERFKGLNIEKKHQLIQEILEETGTNLVVTPKEIDEDIINLSSIISQALNKSLHTSYQKF